MTNDTDHPDSIARTDSESLFQFGPEDAVTEVDISGSPGDALTREVTIERPTQTDAQRALADEAPISPMDAATMEEYTIVIPPDLSHIDSVEDLALPVAFDTLDISEWMTPQGFIDNVREHLDPDGYFRDHATLSEDLFYDLIDSVRNRSATSVEDMVFLMPPSREAATRERFTPHLRADRFDSDGELSPITEFQGVPVVAHPIVPDGVILCFEKGAVLANGDLLYPNAVAMATGVEHGV